MAIELRKTGISVVGDMPWGTHFCQFFETKEDLLDILIPYFKTGLQNNEFCMWIVADPLNEEEARNALRQAVPEVDRYLAAGRIEIVSHTSLFHSSDQEPSSAGRIEIVPHTEWYLKEGVFDLKRVIGDWDEKLAEALARGFDGMRVNGNTAWLTKENWKVFSQYENKLNEMIANQRIIVLCSYPLATSGATEILDVAHTHHFTIARRKGDWQVLETPELKQAKAEIKRLNEELEQRVVERTRELATANEGLRREIIERKRVEEELRNSREQLRNLAAYLQSVREEERTRIARELHDEIGQALTAIKLALERSIHEQPATTRDNLTQALVVANELIGRVRDLSLELRPAMLDDFGLLPALEWHFERYISQVDIKVDFKHAGLEGRRFQPEVETAAYRIVQEALTNVARHAKVDRVEVGVEADENMLRILVKDLGKGFDISSLPATRTGGLSGMRERAIMLGGRLVLDSAPGAGTLLTIELPL